MFKRKQPQFMQYNGTAKLRITTKRRENGMGYASSVVAYWDDTSCNICVLTCAESDMTKRMGKVSALKKLLATLESAPEIDLEEVKRLREADVH
jgi:hypothetical protein